VDPPGHDEPRRQGDRGSYSANPGFSFSLLTILLLSFYFQSLRLAESGCPSEEKRPKRDAGGQQILKVAILGWALCSVYNSPAERVCPNQSHQTRLDMPCRCSASPWLRAHPIPAANALRVGPSRPAIAEQHLPGRACFLAGRAPWSIPHHAPPNNQSRP